MVKRKWTKTCNGYTDGTNFVFRCGSGKRARWCLTYRTWSGGRGRAYFRTAKEARAALDDDQVKL